MSLLVVGFQGESWGGIPDFVSGALSMMCCGARQLDNPDLSPSRRPYWLFGLPISGVRIGIEEGVGLGGNVEKTCWIIVDLVRWRRVLAEGPDSNVHGAIDRAVSTYGQRS